MTTLYCKDNAGHIRIWDIVQECSDIIITHGVHGGVMQQQVETVDKGKASRTVQEQIDLQINSRISKQRDKGYVDTIEEAELGMRNALHLPKPMLALPLDKLRTPVSWNSAYVQRKYDGNRCLIAKRQGKLVAYSRQGKIIDTIDHILDQINIPEGTILDGELYAHGERLQTIVSWIKRKQEGTKNLRYHAYDLVCELPFEARLAQLLSFNFGYSVQPVSTFKVTSHDDMIDWFKDFRKEGYEGAILRQSDLGYEDGKRSKSLIKVKEWQDAEFFVVDIYQSKDGWAILECLAKNGQTFRVTSPGTHEEKEYVWQNKEQFFGKYLTVEYAYLTRDGLPFHPVAKCWRDE